MSRVLVVEDEAPIREMVQFTLARAGLELVEAADAAAARALLAAGDIDLVLIDWMLPGESGLQLLNALKRDPATARLPVIMLTARSESADKVAALEGGADDYVTKPFSPAELTARIRAVLRRAGGEPQAAGERLEYAGIELDAAGHRIEAGGQRLELGPTEYRLLEFFLRHPDRAYSRAQLLDRVWGRDAVLEERTVDVHIRRLRVALAPSGHDALVQTVRGFGYRFSAEAQ
ncbi:MAG TPA: phosphate regulon transcriptional regulator PhoB [Gammaproteobacteria bacterium]